MKTCSLGRFTYVERSDRSALGMLDNLLSTSVNLKQVAKPFAHRCFDDLTTFYKKICIVKALSWETSTLSRETPTLSRESFRTTSLTSCHSCTFHFTFTATYWEWKKSWFEWTILDLPKILFLLSIRVESILNSSRIYIRFDGNTISKNIHVCDIISYFCYITYTPFAGKCVPLPHISQKDFLTESQ